MLRSHRSKVTSCFVRLLNARLNARVSTRGQNAAADEASSFVYDSRYCWSTRWIATRSGGAAGVTTAGGAAAGGDTAADDAGEAAGLAAGDGGCTIGDSAFTSSRAMGSGLR